LADAFLLTARMIVAVRGTFWQCRSLSLRRVGYFQILRFLRTTQKMIRRPQNRGRSSCANHYRSPIGETACVFLCSPWLSGWSPVVVEAKEMVGRLKIRCPIEKSNAGSNRCDGGSRSLLQGLWIRSRVHCVARGENSPTWQAGANGLGWSRYTSREPLLWAPGTEDVDRIPRSPVGHIPIPTELAVRLLA
jgi:hypothetical protein